MPAPKKQLYHSELVKLGPVKVTVKSEPTESSKKKGTYYVSLSVQGFDRYYTPENDACLEFFDGRNGEVLTIVAEESRENARIVLVGENAEQPRQQRQPAKPRNEPQSRAATKPTQEMPRGQSASSTDQKAPSPRQSQSASMPVDGLSVAKRFVAKNRSLAQIALKAAMSVAMEYEGEYKERMPDVLLTSIYASLLYGSSAAGMHVNLPTHLEYKTLMPVKAEAAK